MYIINTVMSLMYCCLYCCHLCCCVIY